MPIVKEKFYKTEQETLAEISLSDDNVKPGNLRCALKLKNDIKQDGKLILFKTEAVTKHLKVCKETGLGKWLLKQGWNKKSKRGKWFYVFTL